MAPFALSDKECVSLGFAAQDCLNARTSVVDPVKHSGVCRLDVLSSHTRKALRLRMSVVRSNIVEVWSEQDITGADHST